MLSNFLMVANGHDYARAGCDAIRRQVNAVVTPPEYTPKQTNHRLTKRHEHPGGQCHRLSQPAEVYALLSMKQECLGRGSQSAGVRVDGRRQEAASMRHVSYSMVRPPQRGCYSRLVCRVSCRTGREGESRGACQRAKRSWTTFVFLSW